MPMPARNASLAVLLIATAASCSTLRPSACPSGQQVAVQELVYFGTQTPAGEVTGEAWADFLATIVTPHFPAGLSSWQAAGQWRSAQGELVHEASHVLSLVHPADTASEVAVGEIVEAYKLRFEQDAVLRVRSPACMSL